MFGLAVAQRGVWSTRAGACTWDYLRAMDFGEWLGAEVKIGQKDKVLPDRVKVALTEAWDKDILEEDDVPEDGTSLDEVQMENDLKVMLKAYADGVKLLKAERFSTDEEKLSMWFRARFTNTSTVLLAGTASKVIMTKEFEEDMEMQGMSGPEDLFLLELALLLGRAVVPSELAGAQYARGGHDPQTVRGGPQAGGEKNGLVV